jgi:hypothetical protein
MVCYVFSGVWMPHFYGLPVKLAIEAGQNEINRLKPAFTGRIPCKMLECLYDGGMMMKGNCGGGEYQDSKAANLFK